MEQQAGVVEVPQVEQVAEVEAPLSIMEHAEQFGPNRDKSVDAEPAPLSADATEAQKAAHHSEQQRREKTGEFKEGRKRHRAASQQGTAADGPRIQELTRKLREAEARLAATPVVAPTPSQVQSNGHAPLPQQPRQEQAPPQAAAPQRRWLGDTQNDPEPAEKDFGGDPMKYLDARYEWLARGVNRFDRKEQQDHQERESVNVSFAQRTHPVAQKYSDFEQVVGALDQSRRIPAGSAIDQFILTDDKGPDVLYHLASNPQELDALLRIPVLQQIKHLALLSQRYDQASSPSTAAVQTTSAPRSSNIRFLPPRPPNVVRTEAQRGDSAPPSADGTLAGHEKQYGPRRQR